MKSIIIVISFFSFQSFAVDAFVAKSKHLQRATKYTNKDYCEKQENESCLKWEEDFVLGATSIDTSGPKEKLVVDASKLAAIVALEKQKEDKEKADLNSIKLIKKDIRDGKTLSSEQVNEALKYLFRNID